METYRVNWTMDINAGSAEEAAMTALKIHRDPDSIATVFIVEHPNGLLQAYDISTFNHQPKDGKIYMTATAHNHLDG